MKVLDAQGAWLGRDRMQRLLIEGFKRE